MKDANAILSTAKETILLESNAIANLAKLLDSSFVDALNFIFNLNNSDEYHYLHTLIKEDIF
ncbi:hypothetical protein [Tenacibaculum bernardetii]|uniref:hypothetical protein n=1 Tax=Tenacibaculum bernardetii TaxID=3021375 RepID=UPI0023AEBC33|nr:hypothetical protein [Tenacibaculum bernardetii]